MLERTEEKLPIDANKLKDRMIAGQHMTQSVCECTLIASFLSSLLFWKAPERVQKMKKVNRNNGVIDVTTVGGRIKSCKGNWMYARMGDLASKVTAALGGACMRMECPR